MEKEIGWKGIYLTLHTYEKKLFIIRLGKSGVSAYFMFMINYYSGGEVQGRTFPAYLRFSMTLFKVIRIEIRLGGY